MIATWLFWVIVLIQLFFGSMITIVVAIFAYQMGAGKLGGGSEVIDFSKCLYSANPKRWRITQVGNIFARTFDDGSNVATVNKKKGVFGSEEITVDIEEIHQFGNVFVYGKKTLKRMWEIEESGFMKHYMQLKNHTARITHELQTLDKKPIDTKLMEKIKILDNLARAVNPYQKSTGSSSKVIKK